jgi:hypothetical protein
MRTKNISNNIKRSLSLRKNHDLGFRRYTDAVEQWRIENMLHCYQPLMEDKSHNRLLNYYFNEVFYGIDISELGNSKTVLKFIDRFFTGTTMLDAALEFNAVSGEISEALAKHFFEVLKIDKITSELYSESCNYLKITDKLDLQINCFEDFAKDINSTVSNPFLYSSIKIARIPAKIAGFKKLYKLVSDGFEILKTTDNPESIAETFINHERTIIKRVKNSTYPIYIPVSTWRVNSVGN